MEFVIKEHNRLFKSEPGEWNTLPPALASFMVHIDAISVIPALGILTSGSIYSVGIMIEAGVAHVNFTFVSVGYDTVPAPLASTCPFDLKNTLSVAVHDFKSSLNA